MSAEQPTMAIFGAAGFVGLHLVKYLVTKAPFFSIVGIDQKKPSISLLQSMTISEDALSWEIGDLNQPSFLETILKSIEPEYIINLIGVFGTEDINLLMEANVTISEKIFQVYLDNPELKAQLRKIILIGSAAEYGNQDTQPIREDFPLLPINLYGRTKKLQTELGLFYHHNKDFPVIIARPFNIIGKGLSPKLLLGKLWNAIKLDAPQVELGNLETKRDFIDVEDVASALLALLQEGKNGEIYNIGMGRSIHIKDLIQLLKQIAQKNTKIVQNPKYFRENDILDIYADISKIRRHTGWKPSISIEESLQRLVDEN